LKKDANVEFGLLSGSHKAGKSKAGSDLDVAVYFKDPPEGRALLYYINALSEVTGVEIDLSEPETQAECFDILRRNKIIRGKTLSNFRAMARFRNRLIHVYDDVDGTITFEVCTKHLKDFDLFARLIRSFMKG
jgi:predicted nucleotidyltransferase